MTAECVALPIGRMQSENQRAACSILPRWECVALPIGRVESENERAPRSGRPRWTVGTRMRSPAYWQSEE